MPGNAKLEKENSLQKENDGNGQALRDEVKQALRNLLLDQSASAAAKASAARTLMEFFADDGDKTGRRATEMTADELDAEIRRLTAGRS